MTQFLVNNVAVVPVFFQPINKGTSTTTRMIERSDDVGVLFEHFNSTNTTAINNLYKHITPTKMLVGLGEKDLIDLLSPVYTDLTETFNTGDFEIPVWCSKMAFLLIGGGGGGSGFDFNFGGIGGSGGGFSYYSVNVVYGVSTGTFNIGYGGAASSSTNRNGSNGNNTFICSKYIHFSTIHIYFSSLD